MGLLDPADWRGQWIAATPDVSAPLLRTDFQVSGLVRRARAYVLGLGYHELRVNGQKADDRVLDPAPTFYDDALTRELGLGPVPRTKYATYDVTSLLRDGDNALGVILGNGWFSVEADIPRSPYHRDPYSDRPVLRLDLRIELTSGETVSVTSGPDWRTTPGPILYNDYCNGEEYDARLEQDGWDEPGFDDTSWDAVEAVPGPSGPPSAQRTPVARVIETRSTTAVDSADAGTRIFDVGQNLVGWVRIRVRGQRGSSVRLRHAARLDDEGRLDYRSNLGDGCTSRQADRYIIRGGGAEIWEPRFTLHGFRFIEVTTTDGASVDEVEARVVHNDVDQVASFASSSALLDQIHSNTVWSIRAGLQGFLQSTGDRCERLGSLGDAGFLADGLFWDYDLASFWADWFDDILDAQMPDGSLPIVAPPHWHAPWGGRPNDFAYQPWPDWMATYPILVWNHYRFYADAGLLGRHYQGMKRLSDWMSTQATDQIVLIGLGDHMEPQPDGLSSHSPKRTPIELTSTAWYYESTRIVAASARALGKVDDARRYERLAGEIRRAFNRRYFDRKLGRYGTGSQTANALPLSLGLAPRGRERDVAADIVANIRARDSHLATGLMGTPALGHALPEHGAADIMLEVMSQTTYPSWGHQIAMGATTGWETWGDDPPGMSLNMWMFAGAQTFLFRDVAGISPASPGWRDLTVRPKLTDQLDSARASIRTPRGEASVDWWREGSDLRFDIVIPSTSSADVWLPTGDQWDFVVFDGEDELWRDSGELRPRPGITRVTRGEDHVRFRVGGGTYILRLRPLPTVRHDPRSLPA
jgi:alpha-L-rhamnosidase